MQHPVDHEAYLISDRQQSGFEVVNGWRLDNTHGDLMHDVLIGIGLHAVANHIVWFCEKGLVRDLSGTIS